MTGLFFTGDRPAQRKWRIKRGVHKGWYAERVAWFSHGFYALREQDGQTTIADLRMGEGDKYTFTFGLGTPQQPDPRPQRLPYEKVKVYLSPSPMRRSAIVVCPSCSRRA